SQRSCFARANTAVPEGVNRRGRNSRSSRGLPTASSRCFRIWDTAGCVIASLRAAIVMFPVSATATNTSSARSSILVLRSDRDFPARFTVGLLNITTQDANLSDQAMDRLGGIAV